MPTLNETASFVRSKNAGPFWITLDVFFDDDESYQLAKTSPKLNTQLFAKIYKVEENKIQFFRIDELKVIKISFPRSLPQGHRHERDMHAGQQYVSILNLEL